VEDTMTDHEAQRGHEPQAAGQPAKDPYLERRLRWATLVLNGTLPRPVARVPKVEPMDAEHDASEERRMLIARRALQLLIGAGVLPGPESAR